MSSGSEGALLTERLRKVLKEADSEGNLSKLELEAMSQMRERFELTVQDLQLLDEHYERIERKTPIHDRVDAKELGRAISALARMLEEKESTIQQ